MRTNNGIRRTLHNTVSLVSDFGKDDLSIKIINDDHDNYNIIMMIRFIISILKSLVILAIWLTFTGAIYHKWHHFLQLHLFCSRLETFTKTKQSIKFQGLLLVTNWNAGKWKRTLGTMYKAAQYWINKIFVQINKCCM